MKICWLGSDAFWYEVGSTKIMDLTLSFIGDQEQTSRASAVLNRDIKDDSILDATSLIHDLLVDYVHLAKNVPSIDYCLEPHMRPLPASNA
jgi:hypothetical protein